MIIGTLGHWRQHLDGAIWEQAFAYLAALGPGSPEEKTILDGEDLFGIVMSYPTRPREDAVLETHRRYIDIQTALVNAEGMDWFPEDALTVKTPYDADKDVAFFHRPSGAAPVHIQMKPGCFAVFYPQDAHMPQLLVGETVQTVKKAVVKVAVDRAGVRS